MTSDPKRLMASPSQRVGTDPADAATEAMQRAVRALQMMTLDYARVVGRT